MLTNFVDHIYCINLEKRPERKEMFIKNLEERAETSLEKVSIPKAVDGTTISKEEMHSNYQMNFPHYTRGAYGCFLSHINCVRDAKEKGFKKILIFEDDVTFVEGFKSKLESFFSNLPGPWDTLWLGANFISKPVEVAPGIARVHSYAAHAYMLTENTYDTILSWDVEAPIDVMYANTLQVKFRETTFHANPRLCGQFAGFSDTEERETDHTGVLGSI